MKYKIFAVVAAVIVGISFGLLVEWKLDLLPHIISYSEAEHNADSDQDQHEPSAGHNEEEIVQLSRQEQEEFGIEVGLAGPGKLRVTVKVPGEVVVNPDRVAHVVPRVSGVVRQVKNQLGDMVEPGDVMALLESRELSTAQAEFLAARERLALAKRILDREQTLWKQKVSSEQEYLKARQTHAEALIEMNSAEQNLHVLGVTDEYLKTLPTHPDQNFEPYRITAPIRGTVTEKHITLGEMLANNSTAFTVADLGDVWINLTIYQKDLASIRPGQSATVFSSQGGASASGTIDYVSPIVDESTRTAVARLVLDNKDGRWRPGMFVTGEIEIRNVEADVVVPRDALQNFEERTVIFLDTPEGFKPEEVTIGRENHTHVEIISGLKAGQRYVSHNAFVLKSELSKGSFGGGHAH